MTTSWFSPWSSDPWRMLDSLRAGPEAPGPQTALTARRVRGAPYPAVNVYASAEGYVLVAELPGVDANALDVTTEGHHVTMRGERRIAYEGDVDIHRQERRQGRFRRTFELPEDADVSKVEALYRNGILMLRIPKAESSLPRSIEIQRD